MSARWIHFTCLLGCLFIEGICLGPVDAQETPSKESSGEQFNRSQPRNWTDLNGNKQLATFAGVLGDRVLLKVGTSTIRLELNKLSKGDIGWIAEVLRREGRINQLPAQYRDFQPSSEVSDPTPNPVPTAAEPSATTTGAPSVGTSVSETPSTSDSASTPAMTPPPGSETPGATQEPVEAVADYREWVDRAGQKLRAKFQSVIGDDVLLKPEQGAITRIPVKNLSRADLKLLRDYHDAKGMLERLPREFRDPIDLTANPESATGADPLGAATSPATPEEKLQVIRTWKDKDGKELIARFLSLNGDQVLLQDQVRRANYGLATLSHDDLEWLQEALREAGRLADLPLPYRDPADRKKSELDLIKHRRTGFYRKWTSFTGKSSVGQYDRFLADGKVRILDANGVPAEVLYVEFSDTDRQYLRDRLAREVPGQFFPEAAPPSPPASDGSSGDIHIWTDLEKRQLTARFVRLDRAGSVAILETAAGETPYIHAFLTEDDQKKIKGIIDSRNALARANAEAARSRMMSGIGGGGGERFSPGNTLNSGPGYTDRSSPPNIRDAMPDVSQLPEFQPPTFTPPPIPTLVWTYQCKTCGTEFGEDSGLKQGDSCPVCSKRHNMTRFGIWGIVAAVVGVGAFFRRR